MSGIFLYILAGGLLLLSWKKDREKTKQALKKGWKSFTNILPQMLVVLLLIGLVLTLLSPELISSVLGSRSGIWGVILAILIGSVTLIPGFVAFPLAAALLSHGAGIPQIAAFISALMMVGVVTLPMEMETIGRRTALTRNLLCCCWSLAVAMAMGVLLG